MSSSSSPMKKPSICRYFANTGSCLHGDQCQFLHEKLPVPSAEERQGVGPDGSNGDQFFNATFNNSNGLSDFPPFPRPKASRSPLGAIAAGAVPPPQGAPMKEDPHMNEQFASLALSNQQQKMQAMNRIPSQQTTPQKVLHTPPSFQGRNPGASEFVPQNSSPANAGGLSHSASSPSFASYAANLSMISNNSSTPATPNHHIPASIAMTSAASPMASPGLSPSGSPLVNRRNKSPLPPMAGITSTPTSNSNAANNSLIHENVGGTTYFYTQEEIATSNGQQQQNASSAVIMPNFTMYPGILPHVGHMKPKNSTPSFFMPDDLKLEILNRHAITMAQIDPEASPEIPAEVDNYHNLFPLEPPPSNPMHKSTTFGYPTTVYKATNVKDGLTYVLRRVHGFRLVNTKCMALIDLWKKIQHANIVQLREVFTTKAFGDHSMVFVYDFHPGSETAMSRYFSHNHHNHHNVNGYNNPYSADGPRPYSASKGKGRGSQQNLLSEGMIWSFVVQLSSALRTIHAHGLACRVVDPTKILMTDKSRLRLNCVGIFDVLSFDPSQSNPLAMMPHYQQEDLVYLGKVILALACNSLRAFQVEHIPNSIELVSRNYSTDLKNFFVYLFTNQNRTRSVNDIMPMIGARFYTQLDAAQMQNDVLENELSKEVENSRLFRLMCKLGTINDRPEFHMDPAWSETGDRYMLKLFRDYLFHQVDENAAPWLDMAHIVQCLNKLDAGIAEKVSLMSRDEQSILVVTYAELKRCLDSSFAEILHAQQQSQSMSMTQ